MNEEKMHTLVSPRIKNKDKFSLILNLNFEISLYVNGNSIIHTRHHLKNAKENGGIFSKYANLPIVKLPAQNNVAQTNIKYALAFLLT